MSNKTVKFRVSTDKAKLPEEYLWPTSRAVDRRGEPGRGFQERGFLLKEVTDAFPRQHLSRNPSFGRAARL